MSRGTSRWKGLTVWVLVAAVVVLLIFNPFAAIFLAVSYGMSAKIAGEEDAAIYGRYLDALDAQVEKEYLKKAILGQCPKEITQLSHPLPESMNSDVRENMASAAVGGPVKIIAKPRESSSVPPKI
jgi:hypothetical protein